MVSLKHDNKAILMGTLTGLTNKAVETDLMNQLETDSAGFLVLKILLEVA